MEKRERSGQKMVLKQFSRRGFKQRREGTGRETINRAINFDKLVLSDKKPSPPSSSSLFKNVSSTLKENVQRETKIAQNVDDFWTVERQKRISAVARRKLTGSKESTQGIKQQPVVVQPRRDRHARSRRDGGDRRPQKLEVHIDAEFIADWDEENLEEEEEKPCTIASSEAFLSAQETVLRASFPLVDKIHSQVEANPADGQPGEQMTHQEESRRDNEQTKSCNSGDDMEVCSEGSPGSLMDNNIFNRRDCTPDLSTLVKMDVGASSPTRNPLHSRGEVSMLDEEPGEQMTHQEESRMDNDRAKSCKSVDDMDLCSGGSSDSLMHKKVFNPHDCTPDLSTLVKMHQTPDLSTLVKMDMNTTNVETKTLSPRDGMSQGTCLGAEPRGSISSPHIPMEDMPLQNTPSQRKRLHVTPATSPTPPANPYVTYLSRRELLCASDKRKLAFGSSPSSLGIGIDIGEDSQMEDIQDFDVDWDGMSYNYDPNHAANMQSPVTNACSGFALNDGSEADKGKELEIYVCDARKSQEGCSRHERTPNVKSKSRQKSGSSAHAESLKGNSGISQEVDGSRTFNVMTMKTTQGEKVGLSSAAKALVCEGNADKGVKTPDVPKPQVPAFKSDKTIQREKMTLSGAEALPFQGLNEDTPRVDKPPLSPCKSVRTLQVEKTGLSTAAKALKFGGEEVDSPGVCESPVSAVKNKQGEKSRLSDAVKALNFEDVAVEATLDPETVQFPMEEPQEATELASIHESGEAQLLTEKPPEATELEVTLQANTTQRINQENQTDSITSKILQPEVMVQANTTQPCASQETQTGRKRPGRTKAQARRCSLEGSENGSSWTNGQRRSQRTRFRPLEWWRGEKLLYGRVNDTLTTVIGIKQSLPGKPFVVESFVPAKYNDLVRFAAI